MRNGGMKERAAVLGGELSIKSGQQGGTIVTLRLLRDAKLYEIGAGTTEIRRMLIGRELFEETK